MELREKFCKRLTVVMLGVFSIIAQVFLFRDFLFFFDGNEIAIGVFLFGWLGWIGIGGFFWRVSGLLRYAGAFFIYLLMLYPPAFILQKSLLFNARWMFGVQEFELMGLFSMIGGAILFSFPVSFLTGLLFVSAVEWKTKLGENVGVIYILEAFGSALGALLATLLICYGWGDETIFLFSSAMLFGGAGLNIFWKEERKSQAPYFLALLISGATIVLLMDGFGGRWSYCNDSMAWRRVVKSGTYKGSFQTPQAKYLYGNDSHGFTILSFGTACDALNYTESVVLDLGFNLSQMPAAKKVMVIGQGGFALSRAFSMLPQVTDLIWLEIDHNYPAKLISVLPNEFLPVPVKMRIPGKDVIQWLRQHQVREFDLIIVRLPPPDLLALSRYYGIDFIKLLHGSLRRNGVVSFAFAGGENYLSEESSGVGGLLLNNLQREFSNIILQPGEKSCYYASDERWITADPALLASRLAGLQGVSTNFPLTYFEIAFDPLRAEQQMVKYRKTGEKIAHIAVANGMATSADFIFTVAGIFKKISGRLISPVLIMEYSSRLWWWFVVALSAVMVVVSFLGLKYRQHHDLPVLWIETDRMLGYFSINCLVFLGSAAIISLNILLLTAFQIVYGSVFLYFGLLVAVLMIGMVAGGICAERYRMMSMVGGSVLLLLLALSLLLLLRQQQSFVVYPALNWCIGWIGGMYLPRAAKLLRQRACVPGRAAAWLSASDYAGGACGGLITMIVLIPVFGVAATALLIMYLSVLLVFFPLFIKLFSKN